jgi:hypothetical protein
MRGWSFYGCGVMQLGLRHDDKGLLETTRWITLFFVPIVPLSRWRVRYAGTARRFGPDNDESFVFHHIERLPLDPLGVIQTALCGFCLVAIAIGPAVGCVFAMPCPPNSLQMALLLGSCVWPLGVTMWVQRHWRAVVQQSPESWLDT